MKLRIDWQKDIHSFSISLNFNTQKSPSGLFLCLNLSFILWMYAAFQDLVLALLTSEQP